SNAILRLTHVSSKHKPAKMPLEIRNEKFLKLEESIATDMVQVVLRMFQIKEAVTEASDGLMDLLTDTPIARIRAMRDEAPRDDVPKEIHMVQALLQSMLLNIQMDGTMAGLTIDARKQAVARGNLLSLSALSKPLAKTKPNDPIRGF
ncbi:hypothetical protein SEUCBS140593_007681, partial [Sporothrix eucalyptigena]